MPGGSGKAATARTARTHLPITSCARAERARRAPSTMEGARRARSARAQEVMGKWVLAVRAVAALPEPPGMQPREVNSHFTSIFENTKSAAVDHSESVPTVERFNPSTKQGDRMRSGPIGTILMLVGAESHPVRDNGLFFLQRIVYTACILRCVCDESRVLFCVPW